MEPRFCSVTGALLASAVTPIAGLPELREGEVYCIDDSDHSGDGGSDNFETFTTGEALAARLSEMANDRDMGTNDYSCHNERPIVFIRRQPNVEFSVKHSIAFG